MSITAKSILQRATETSNDKTSIHWSVNELVRYLNDGMREIAMYRPDAFNTVGIVTTVAGTKQTIPADGIKLIGIPRNGTSAAPGRALSACDRIALDNSTPDWHTRTPAAVALHYMFDVAEPKRFWLYPPSVAGTALEVNYCATPTDVDETTVYTTYADLPTTPMLLQPVHANALGDYVLFRQYLKDSQDASNAQRSQNHLTLFANALGIELKTTMALADITRRAAPGA